MKIAFIGQRGIPSLGDQVEHNVEEISVRLAKQGHEVFVYTLPNYTPREYKKYEGIRLIGLFDFKLKWLNNLVYWLAASFRAGLVERVRLIHWQSKKAIWVAPILRVLRPNLRQIMSVYTWFGQKRSQRLMASIFGVMVRVVDRVVVNNHNLQRYLLQKFNILAKLIFEGVGGECNPGGIESLQRLGLVREKYVLVRDQNIKEAELRTLIEAFMALKQKTFAAQEFKLVIANSRNIRVDQGVRDLVDHNNDVVLVGDQSRDSLDELIGQAGVVIYPGRLKGGEILRDMFSGRGILVASLEENLEVINNGLGKAVVFDFKYQDKADLAYRLELLVLNPDMVRRVGRQAREYVRVYHNWEEIMVELEKLYQQVVLVEDVRGAKLGVPELIKI